MNGNGFASAPLAGVLTLLIAVAAAWLAVADQPAAQTLLLAGVAVLYLVAPPSGQVPRPILILLGAALLMGLTAFLPTGDWESIRRPFLERGIVLPVTHSAQPWWSLEDALLLFASLLWAWNCFEARFSLHQRKYLLAAFLIASAAVAASSLLRDTAPGQGLPDWAGQIGQFPNRNQTGSLLVMAALGSFARGLSDILNRKKQGLLWMVLTGLFAAAIVQNGSRGAALLLGLGVLLLFGFMGRLRRHGLTSWAVVTIVVVAAFCLFYYQGAYIVGRFRELLSNEQGGRTLIYEDTLLLILRSPWLGVGLGNFPGFFNIDRPHTQMQGWYAVHPESDWLWIGAELGLAGLVIFALLVFFAFRTYFGKSPFPVLTHASLAIAIVFLLHSLFDVGGHRPGTMWTCLFLVGLGAFRPVSLPVYRVPRLALRLAGLFLLVVVILRVQSMSDRPWMPTRASRDAVDSLVVVGSSVPEQTALLDRALGWGPLEWRLYFQRGLVAEHAGHFSTAAADFRRCLFLDQNTVALPLAVAEACRWHDLPGALAAWREALRRAGSNRPGVLQEIYYDPGLDERARLQLATLAEDDPVLQLTALVNLDPTDFEWSRENFLASNPALAGVPSALARTFFEHWIEVGDAAKLADEWPQHPEWEAAGWRAYAKALAKAGLFDAAVQVVLKEIPPPPQPTAAVPPPLPEALGESLLHPQDVFSGIQLYQAQTAAGQADAALKTLQGVAQLPNAPPFVAYLLAHDLLAAGRVEDAWHALDPLVSQP